MFVEEEMIGASQRGDINDTRASALFWRLFPVFMVVTLMMTLIVACAPRAVPESGQTPIASLANVYYKSVEINGVEIAYREAGDSRNPTVLLLHGFPTSSQMFRNLIPALAKDYHVLAPDYPGYGSSAMPPRDDFEYSFANFANIIDAFMTEKGVSSYALYLMDYGAPVGYRVFAKHPDRVTAFVIQNGNAYEEGLREFWDPIKAYWAEPNAANRDALRGLLTIDATKWQYTHCVGDTSRNQPGHMAYRSVSA